MDGYTDATQGDRYADTYDALYAPVLETTAAVETLARLAAGGPVLELGVGTGRLAIPLAGRGLTVHGLDASAAMLDRLRHKPGGDLVRATLCDFADVPVEGPFAVAVAACNTFFDLVTVEAQRRCLEGVRRVLEPDGRLVVEAFVPDDDAAVVDDAAAASDSEAPGLEVRRVGTDLVVLAAWQRDRSRQSAWGQNLVLTEEGVRLHPWKVRYASPDQLDAMARSAGLVLVERWSDWRGTPFDNQSTAHVSIYGCHR